MVEVVLPRLWQKEVVLPRLWQVGTETVPGRTEVVARGRGPEGWCGGTGRCSGGRGRHCCGWVEVQWQGGRDCH